MHSTDYKERYLQLLHQFLGSEMDGSTFQAAYMQLWKQDRDETYRKSESWPERFDLHLVTALERSEISREDFGRKWVELWGYADDVLFAEMRDKIFTACDSFIEDPIIRAQPYEYDEVQFQVYVKETFAAYKAQVSR